MPAARCIWPIEDPDLHLYQAILEARADLPRLLALNEWHQAGDPHDWIIAEGVDSHRRPVMYLVCQIDVLETPREFHHYRWENVAVDAYGNQLTLAAA